MNGEKNPIQAKWPTFRVGDQVELTLGQLIRAATVLEDRGPIAGPNRHLYTVHYLDDTQESHTTTVPAHALRLAHPVNPSVP